MPEENRKKILTDDGVTLQELPALRGYNDVCHGPRIVYGRPIVRQPRSALQARVDTIGIVPPFAMTSLSCIASKYDMTLRPRLKIESVRCRGGVVQFVLLRSLHPLKEKRTKAFTGTGAGKSDAGCG